MYWRNRLYVLNMLYYVVLPNMFCYALYIFNILIKMLQLCNKGLYSWSVGNWKKSRVNVNFSTVVPWQAQIGCTTIASTFFIVTAIEDKKYTNIQTLSVLCSLYQLSVFWLKQGHEHELVITEAPACFVSFDENRERCFLRKKSKLKQSAN